MGARMQITPQQGLGPVRFGMTKKDARDTLKKLGLALSSSQDTLDFFGTDNALQIDYDDGTVSFVGISHSKAFTVEIDGIDPFDTPARALFDHLRAHHGSGKEKWNESEHLFRKGIVTLYEADAQYDPKGTERVMWGQIGIGDDRYLAAVG
jgi:hypothetical protein